MGEASENNFQRQNDTNTLDDDSLLLALDSNKNCITVPNGAVDLFPRKVGPRIFYLPDRNQILKAGSSVKESEAEAARFVALQTSVPVPEVFDWYVKDGIGYIFMSKADGEPLADLWAHLTAEEKSSVVTQLQCYAQQLRSLTGEFYGALWNSASQDIFFNHLPYHQQEVHYGPYYSRQEYNDGLVTALENSRPSHSLNDSEKALANKALRIEDETKVFCHGDFQPLNILIDRSGRVTAIIDWECAGFSICGREYYEARARSRSDEWAGVLDEIFPEEARVHFELLREFDQALTQYTGL